MVISGIQLYHCRYRPRSNRGYLEGYVEIKSVLACGRSTTSAHRWQYHITVDVRGPLSIPLLPPKDLMPRGSVGHKGKEKEGNISNRVLAVSCHHVLFEKPEHQV